MDKQVKRTQKAFPTATPDKISALLSTINTDPKAIFMSVCLDQVFRTGPELAARYRSWVSWPRRANVFKGYCHQTLVPIGVVAEEQTTHFQNTPETETTWRATEEGWNYARLASARSLLLSDELSTSFYSIFSDVHTPKGRPRSPFTVYNIFKSLSQGGLPLRDILTHVQTNRASVILHLNRLSKDTTLLTYDSFDPLHDGTYAAYDWISERHPDEVPAYSTIPTLTQKVARHFAHVHTSDRREAAKALSYDHPGHVSSVIQHLLRQGFLVPSADAQILSHAQLTPDGQKVQQFFSDLECLVSGEDLGWEESVAQLNPELLQRAVDRYRVVSHHGNSVSYDLQSERVLSYVREYQARHDQGPSRPQIAEQIGLRTGRAVVARMVKEGKLLMHKEGRSAHYTTP